MTIRLNKESDKETYKIFHEMKVAGVDFGQKILGDHPSISLENYNSYIDSYYQTHETELNEILEDTNKCFSEIRKVLFSELKNYFGYDYQNEDYTCELSIFNCNPRFLETKTFQVFYKRSRNMRKEVIVHEITHFAFYDFCEKNKISNKNDKSLWELSEIFNVIFLNNPLLQKAIGAEELLFYPNLKDKLDYIKTIWSKNPNPKDFLIESLGYLQINK